MRRLVFVLALPAAVPSLVMAAEATADLPMPSAELLVAPPRTPALPSLHPPVVLKDRQGTPVLVSGGPVSAARTCDGCHDVGFIASHDGHAVVAGAELDRDPALLVNGNCFLCHARAADNGARLAAMQNHQGDWAETATLAGTGLAVLDKDDAHGWQWQKQAFSPDGSVAGGTLGLGRPGSRACGFCHGRVHQDAAPLHLAPDPTQRMTDLGGTIFSGQRLSDSAVNLAGKVGLYRPWDVHAERLLSCASCHFSPNHPAYMHATEGPAHLEFEARRVSISEYLRRPDHRLARGVTEEGRGGNIRRCESCHDAPRAHRFLPRPERHLAAMLCETCHVPMAYAPARQETDWTMLTAERQPRRTYRGGDAAGFVTGFRPALLRIPAGDGTRKLGPANLVTVYAWVEQGDGKPHPVKRELLEQAFFTDGTYKPELLRVLDTSGDGKLQDGELVLGDANKVKVARDLLVAAGAKTPELSAEIRPFEMHHGVSPGRYATRECTACHEAGSRLAEPVLVASSAPFGVTPVFAAESRGKPEGALVRDGQGRVWFQPQLAGLHVFGYTRSGVLDGLGWLMVVGVFVGAATHAFLRFRSARRRGKEKA
jgi:hypothetical protein